MNSTPLRGVSTIELLIAFAVLTITLTAVITVIFGNQSVAIDTGASMAAIARAGGALEDERALTGSDFLAASTTLRTYSVDQTSYQENMSITDLNPCEKRAVSALTWDLTSLRPQRATLSTLLTDMVEVTKLGGDCAPAGPYADWKTPSRYSSDSTIGGKPTALDVLGGIAYMGIDAAPFLAIADTRETSEGPSSGLMESFTSPPPLTAKINSIDVVRKTESNGTPRIYGFAAMNAIIGQLTVLDLTERNAPQVVNTFSLSPCVKNSFPQGWYVYAYDDSLYMVTRETAGPEFHILNVSNPTSPYEFPIGSASCKGYELTDTVEQMVVRDQIIDGIRKRYAYLVTDESDQEVRVLDVTNPLTISQVAAIDLPGSQDALSVFVMGMHLYVGRQSTPSGPELYLYQIQFPSPGLSLISTREIGADVLGIRAGDQKVFLATKKQGQEVQVIDSSTPTELKSLSSYNFSNISLQGIEYGPQFIYVIGQGSPNLLMLSSS